MKIMSQVEWLSIAFRMFCTPLAVCVLNVAVLNIPVPHRLYSKYKTYMIIFGLLSVIYSFIQELNNWIPVSPFQLNGIYLQIAS